MAETLAASELVLGGGCFWCLEAAFELVPGVFEVESGYAGGSAVDPSYERVSSGLTGHAEVVRIRYDATRVGVQELLDLFFHIHDPTTEDRQGADIGPQYRSIILYANAEQRAHAERAIARAQAGLERTIVTELSPLERFWPAEGYHQDYFRKNPSQGYCRIVIQPKVEKAERFIESLGPSR